MGVCQVVLMMHQVRRTSMLPCNTCSYPYLGGHLRLPANGILKRVLWLLICVATIATVTGGWGGHAQEC